jgi:RNA-binding protein YhbY
MEPKSVVQIGKKGLTPALLDEIRVRLKTQGLIRVKILKPRHGESEQILQQILVHSRAKLVRKTGFVFVLMKGD